MFYIAYIKHTQEWIAGDWRTVVEEYPFNGNGNSFEKPGTLINKTYKTRAAAERQARKRWNPASVDAGYIQIIEV
mgnify:CR=1 FL=1